MTTAFASPAPDGAIDYTLAGFELNDIFKGPNKLNPAQQEIAVDFIRWSHQIQLERLQCLADGALLAAEQVQDVRLDLLEKGPEVNAKAVIFDLFIGLLLDSSVVGALMKKFAASSCAQRLIARSAILKVDGKAIWAQTKEEYKVIKEFIGSKELYDTMKEEMSGARYLEHARGWRTLVEMAGSSDAQKNVVAGLKGARAFKKAKFETPDLDVDGDTPGVSLLGAIHEHVSHNRLLVQMQYQRMETFVRLGFMTGDEARKFLTLAEFEELEATLKVIRDRAKLVFEAIIWAGIFKFEELWGRYSARDGLKGIDKRLMDYWIMRFGPDIMRWNHALGNQGRGYLRILKIDEWNDLERLRQEAEVGRYFIRVLHDLPDSLKTSNALVTNFNPTHDIK